MATLAEIRAKLKEQENRSSGGSGGDNAIYPFWNLKKVSQQRFVSYQTEMKVILSSGKNG